MPVDQRNWALRDTKASKARLPPSPLLSARVRMMMYLTLTTSIIDQKISEMTPNTWIWLIGKGWEPAKVSRNA